MSDWNEICRVCSSSAEYNIFAKIPSYLHESSHEFINWQKPINVILEETTGLKITEDDGLPKSICRICVSYMKHASIFRDQVIKNTLSLQVIKKLHEANLVSSAEDKDSILISEQELPTSEERKIDTNILQQDEQDKVTKELFLAGNIAPTPEYIIQQMRYLNLLFDKDINSGIKEIKRQASNGSDNAGNNRQQSEGEQEDYETETTSNDENDDNNSNNSALRKGHILSYSEKNFEEDDVVDMDDIQDIININIPESCKERKCRACFRRFMFEDSCKEHMEKCVEYKFLLFIEETNLLLDIRRHKAVSPHEFIRRMIFSLRKINDFLKLNCDELSDCPLPDFPVNNNDSENDDKNINCEKDSLYDMTLLFDKNVESTLRDDDIGYKTPPGNRQKIDSLDDYNNYSLAQRNSKMVSPNFIKDNATPISIHNNILYEIERSESRNANQRKITNIEADHNVMRPIPMHASVQTQQTSATSPFQRTTSGSSAEERQIFLKKLERAVCQTPQTPNIQTQNPQTPSISIRKDLMPKSIFTASSPCFSACCNPCNLTFDTLSEFEIHNAIYHNKNNVIEETVDNEQQSEQQCERSDSDEEQRRIIDMFENEDDFYDDT